MTLPKLFEDRMRELLQDEYEDYVESLNQKPNSGLRVNTLKITLEEFEKISPFEIHRIPWISNGYYVKGTDQPARHPYYHAGLYYIQEPSAMTPASLLPVKPGDKVLDLCAAPGGKSTELAAMLEGKGVLIANDISNSRAKALQKNIELFGVCNAVVMSEDHLKLSKYFEGYFDKILIDAPCSGEGMFRKNPAMMKSWEVNGPDNYSALQKDIIIHAARMLKPGGSMLYSTCTFSPEENEGTIGFLLEQCPEFHVVNPIEDKASRKDGISYDGFSFGRPDWINGPDELKNCIRLWPHKLCGEGHFIALLEKDSLLESQHNLKDNVYVPSIISPEAEKFVKQLTFSDKDKNQEIRNDKIYWLPDELPNLKGLRILRSGLFVGEMKKNRFEPSQPLASSLKIGEFQNNINLSIEDSNVIKYLKGETIQVTGEYPDGWQLICVEGYPLGWGKLTGGTLKNKYFTGWRWM